MLPRYFYTVLTIQILLSPSVLADVVTYKLLNGDSISGELISEESTDDLKVIIQPQLGRIVIKTSMIKMPDKSPIWKTNIEVGLNGSNTGDQESFWGSMSAKTTYKERKNELNITGNYD